MFKVIVLFRNLRIVTSGVTGASNVYERIDLDSPALRDALLDAESVTLITGTVSPSAPNVEWNIEIVPGLDRDMEAAAFAIAGDVSASGPLRSAAYTTLTSFLPHARPVLRYKNKNDISGVLTAQITAILLVKKAG